ncbi:MAG: Ribosomal small subunit methyltransferase, partial [Verrucomicrobiales bacterium]|nr:Ribosomal small subunit methyltransferase [Verrucomicrobiales bacterium]
MKLSEMKEVLAREAILLTKSLGQNFLHDQNQLLRIVGAGELTKQDKVLEIGPGLGPLTEHLLIKSGEVFAIEKDRRLVEFLNKKFVDVRNFKLLHDDALDYVKIHREWKNWKLIANLPYSVASPILVELALANEAPERMVTTLQIEVAQRIAAKTDDDDYGILTLLLQLHYEPREWFKIPAACFFPAPDVDSACITLIRRKEPLLPRELVPIYVKIVKRAFSQRRKMMMKLMKQDWPLEKLQAAFDELKLSPQIRAEKVSMEQFAQFTRILTRG